ncbi:probable nucleoside diphosphate kinase 5 [Diospyros lotus]|uniref:probable nucleoside diphosphate kinase 5 n=1 Tax=Diospyros lotus TaxID=55363 RepID=UPI0022503425|nr:probable nucleoside diphosphate kinase 5 [Diospyros lotus]
MASEARSLPHLLVLPRNYRSIVQIAPRFISFSANFTVLFLVASAISSSLRVSGDGCSDKEKTLAIVKPDGFLGNYTNTIKEIILDSGFSISMEMITQLNEETVKIFYAEHSAKSFFPRLLKYMTSGPVLVMVLEKVNAIADWRAMIGPTDAHKAKVTHPNSIRAMCGLDLERNCVHGSDSSGSATREIYFFFKETSPGVFSKHDEL